MQHLTLGVKNGARLHPRIVATINGSRISDASHSVWLVQRWEWWWWQCETTVKCDLVAHISAISWSSFSHPQHCCCFQVPSEWPVHSQEHCHSADWWSLPKGPVLWVPISSAACRAGDPSGIRSQPAVGSSPTHRSASALCTWTDAFGRHHLRML